MSRTRSKSKTLPLGRRTTSPVHSAVGARGFTLVEMLVAVTLVLLMMSMFAQVFEIAGSSIAKTRGLAENDQRSRTLQTIIKADLDKRSFRWVYPFAAGEDLSAPESNSGNRQGYFYVSENNPYNSLDDVLQFTVDSTITSRNKDDSPYYGQALKLAGNSTAYKNQPDYDDLQWFNNTADSTVAELVYFVRNGNLYRRQLMIREQAFGSDPEPDDSPANNPARHVFDPTLSPAAAFQYLPGTRTFWADYDFGAYYNENASNLPTGAHFLGTNSLDNRGLSFGAIAAPFRRYGHYHTGNGVTSGHAGRPKEFIADTTGADFIGRFTLQECSDPDFQYPHNKTSGSRIPTNPTLALTLDPNDKTVTGPDDFGQGTRRGEDLLLSNVHAFDILVWDENYGGFVNIGDPSLPATSDYSLTKRKNNSYGPRVTENTAVFANNAVFDTWHRQLNIDGAVGNDEPPFHPITFRPDYAPYLGYPEPTPSNGARPKTWTENTAFLIGDIVFPTAVYLPAGTPFYYRCVDNTKAVKVSKKKGKGGGSGSVGSSGLNLADEPVWPRAAGLVVEDNTLAWQAVDNRKPLKAIKLEIRFVDTSTQQLRQLTIIHSLVD